MRGFWFTSAVGCLTYWILLGQLDRTQFGSIITLFAVLFFIYFYLIKSYSQRYWLYLPLILFHAIAFNFTPGLSDDYWRFLWDGHLTFLGLSPYEYTPTQLLEAGKTDVWLTEIYHQLNSPNYYSVYPPLNQVLFSLAGMCKTPEAGLLVLKTIVLSGNILLFMAIRSLIKRLKWGSHLLWLVVLNPLFIIETTGNLHFEGLTIALFLFGVTFILQNKLIWAGLLMGMAISVKLVPLLFLPFLFNTYGWKKNIPTMAVILFLNLILCIPFVNLETIGKISQSINLYFQTFEFNSLGFGLLNKTISSIVGFNTTQWVGPICTLLFLMIGGWIWVSHWRKPEKNMWKILMIILLAYYCLSTTVHPWYILYPLVIGLFAQSWYGVYFSLVVILSYAFYLYGNTTTHQLIIVFEYLLLISLIWKSKWIEKNFLYDLNTNFH